MSTKAVLQVKFKRKKTDVGSMFPMGQIHWVLLALKAKMQAACLDVLNTWLDLVILQGLCRNCRLRILERGMWLEWVKFKLSAAKV